MNAKTKKLLKICNIPHTLSLDSEARIDYAHYKAPIELDYEYFCPTCDTLFKKWKEARLHKEKTGHGCRHCKDCGEYFPKEKLRKVHEDQTGHTNYSGQFYAKNRMSIKHYLPKERLVAVNKLQKNEIDVEGFSIIIEELIGEDEVSGAEIDHRVRRYQKENDWPTLGSRAFLGAFGIPKNRGLVNAIISIMGDGVTVIGEDSVTRKIRLNSKQTTPETEPEPESPPTSPDVARIDGFNSSSQGLRLPATPNQMAQVLVWFCSNYSTFSDHSEARDALKATKIIPAHRSVHTLRAIYRGLSDDNVEWPISSNTSLQNPLSMADAIEKNCIGEGPYDLPPNLASDYIERVREYFASVKSILSDVRSLETANEPTPESPPKPITVSQESTQPFTQVRSFNTSSRGMRLPREPSDTAKIILHTQAALRDYDFVKTLEVTDYVNQKTGIPRGRTSKAVDYCLQDYRTTFENKTTSAPDYDQCPSQEALAQKLESKEAERHEECGYSEEEIEIIRLYFAHVRFHITANS